MTWFCGRSTVALTACTQRLHKRIIKGIFTLNLVGGRCRLMQQEKGQIQARHETVFFGPMLERLVAREPQAVRKFIASFTPAVHSIIRTILGISAQNSPQELMEYTQDCFLKIFQKISTFDESKGNRLETWAYAVAKNLMRDAKRRRQSRNIGGEISLDESERAGETESDRTPPNRRQSCLPGRNVRSLSRFQRHGRIRNTGVTVSSSLSNWIVTGTTSSPPSKSLPNGWAAIRARFHG